MDTLEIILLVAGTMLTLAGYIYNKTGTSKKKTKIPKNYTEYIGICKKHIKKNGEFHELFEISFGGKTLKYSFPTQDSEEKLREIDSIEKFYIDNCDPDTIKTASDFSDKNKPMSKTCRYLSYAIAGTGLICIIVVLVKIAFYDLQ